MENLLNKQFSDGDVVTHKDLNVIKDRQTLVSSLAEYYGDTKTIYPQASSQASTYYRQEWLQAPIDGNLCLGAPLSIRPGATLVLTLYISTDYCTISNFSEVELKKRFVLMTTYTCDNVRVAISIDSNKNNIIYTIESYQPLNNAETFYVYDTETQQISNYHVVDMNHNPNFSNSFSKACIIKTDENLYKICFIANTISVISNPFPIAYLDGKTINMTYYDQYNSGEVTNKSAVDGHISPLNGFSEFNYSKCVFVSVEDFTASELKKYGNVSISYYGVKYGIKIKDYIK